MGAPRRDGLPPKLRLMAKQLRQELAALDTHREECECCGLMKWRDRDDGQASVELEAVAGRLERWALKLEGRAARQA